MKNPSEFIIKWDLLNVKQKSQVQSREAPVGRAGSGRGCRLTSQLYSPEPHLCPPELPDLSKDDGKTQFNLSPFYKG